MIKGKFESLFGQLTAETAEEYFYPVCGTAYGIHTLFFLLSFLFKKNFLMMEAVSMGIGICAFLLFCSKLSEQKQKIGFFFLQAYPFSMISSLLSVPVFKMSEKLARMGTGGSLSVLAVILTFLTAACLIAFYLSETGRNTVTSIKEKLKSENPGDSAKTGKPGDVVLCMEKESGKAEIWPYKDRFLHMLILGATGTGKTSQTILPLINQDMKNLDAGITVLEPKGDLAQKAAMMAKYYGRECIYFDPSFKNCPHFNPLFGKEADVVENMATTFRMLNPDSPQFFLDLNEQLMRNAVKVLKRLDKAEGVDGRHSTFIELSRLLQNSGGIGRKMVVEFSQITSRTQEEAKENADIASWFLNDYFAERSKVYENTSGVRSQVAKLVSNEYLREVLNPDFDAGQRNEIDFDKHLASGGVICISTAQGVLRDLGKYLGYFIILQLQSAVFRRPGNEDTRRPHFLYIDEFQTYSNPGFSDMLTQGRSYRVASHLATQARAQMAMGGGRDGKNFVELVSTNARNIVLYPGCSKDDAEYYSKQFGEYEKVEVQIGKSYKTFNLFTGGLDRLGHPTETVREAKKMTAVFSPSDLIYRPFGEIVYCIIKNNSIQIPKVGKIEYIPKDLNDTLNQMIDEYVRENSRVAGEEADNMETETDSNFEFEDPAAEDLRPDFIEKPAQNYESEDIFFHEPVRDEIDPMEEPMDELEAAKDKRKGKDLFEDTYFDDCMDDAENDFLL